MELLKKLIELTHIEIEKPQAYDTFHILFVFFGLVVVALLVYLLRNVSERGNKIVLLTCGIFLILTEVYKQLYYYFLIGDPGYDWWIFPFQLCSVPMYLCVIVVFLKPGRIKNALYNFLAIFNMFGGAISFAEPSGLLHPYLTLTAHAFVWHMMLVFIGVYLIATKRAGTKLKDYLGAISVFGCCACVAQLINVILRKTNANMFYISPFRHNPIVVFNSFWYSLGPWITMILYLFSLSLGAFIIFVIQLYSIKLIKLIIKKVKLLFE